MKITCEIIEDLLPLYYDGVCSENSRECVEEHLTQCASCNETFEKMSNVKYDNTLKNERQEVVLRHTRTIKRKSLAAGIGVASVLCIPVLITMVINLVAGHALDWFFIVLTSLMMLASITVVPLALEKNKWFWTILSFTASLILLLIACAVYTGGTWQDYGQTAFFITPACLTLPWGLFLIIRYIKANTPVKAGLCVMFCGIFFSMIENVIYWAVEGVFRIQIMSANLVVWNENTVDANVFLLGLISGCFIGGLLIIIGLLRKKEG